MPSCIVQVVKGITVKDMKTSVSSYTSSLHYMRKIVPLAIYNIVYNRVNFDANLFKNDSVCDIPFKRIKSGTKNHILADIFYWVKGIVDAIEKKRLQEMHLLFKNNTDNIIMEDYKFNFTYESDPKPEKLPNSEDVINVTRQFFQAIESLSTFKKMDEDIGIFIELMLFDESSLQGYDPPYFTHSSGIPLFFQMPELSLYNTIGYLKTGYHKMKCSVKGTQFTVESRASSVVIDDLNENLEESKLAVQNIDDNADEPKAKKQKKDETLDLLNTSFANEMEDRISVGSPTCSEVEDPDRLVNKDDVHCPCEINAIIGSTKTIKCSICLKYQHLNCVGCTIELPQSLRVSYTCAYCNSEDHQYLDKYFLTREQSEWKLICGFRLVLSYLYYYEREPTHLLQRMDHSTRNYILKLFKVKRIMNLHPQNGFSMQNKDTVATIMSQLFPDFRLPSTMMLDDDIE